MNQKTDIQDITKEISDLESRLQDAKARLAAANANGPNGEQISWPHMQNGYLENGKEILSTPIHALLLLSDSALPLGSFAYSNGLESFIAHNKPLPRSITPLASFRRFLKLSIASVASTSLPYILAAYRHPEDLETLDNDMDASTTCIVAQRASVAQGRALMGVWERSFRWTYASKSDDSIATTASKSLEAFSDGIKSTIGTTDDIGPKGHFPVLWGVICLAMGVDIQQVAYIFMVNHAKAVLSAAVRASVMGPYQAQTFLASKELQETIIERIEREWDTDVTDAGQVVPPLDLWVGRHELLYSRIFNS